MKSAPFIACLLLPALFAATAAGAQPAPVKLDGAVELEKTVIENGRSKTVLAEPKVVLPGDRLLFTTRYRNDGTAALQNFIVTNPVPSGVAVADASAAALEVSVDAGKAWGRLAVLTVADGKGGRRAATAGDVTHVRWMIPAIAPGASGAVQYHAVVR